MHKIVRLGTRKIYGGRSYSVYCEITIKDGKLSIHGVEGPLASGNCLGSCGQIDMGGLEMDSYAPGWSAELVEQFADVWDRWHLNDMQAGCEHQRALGWTKYNEHPNEPCPECGYKYGSAWLKEELPQEVIDFLASLPDTDRTPAWV
jgi:hypothetical protein